MAFLGKPRDDNQYGRLMGMIAPETTPAKRIGTEAPTGSVTAGPSAGKSSAEFTQTQRTSPGSVFARQLSGADISGVSKLAERPLEQEAQREGERIASEGKQYREARAAELTKQPQFDFSKGDVVGKIAQGGEEFGTAQNILSRTEMPVQKLNIGEVKEFTPMQALRGGSVEGLLKKEAAGPYTTGMAGLDALLFGKKGGGAQLAERGAALRSEQQRAAEALAASETEAAQQRANEFIKQQKGQLESALKGGITAREEAYTKAMPGQQSKVEQEQQRLLQDYQQQLGRMSQAREADIAKRVEDLKAGALENTINKLRQESIALQESAGKNVQGSVGIRIPTRSELLEAAKNDPRYRNALQNIEAQVPFAQQRGQLKYGAMPTVGLENVISAEDAAQYNRLQQLLGGKAITPTAAKAGTSYYDAPDLARFFSELNKFTNV